VLIYLDTEAQKRILPNFHYALSPGGFLFLGASESVGPFTNLFVPTDKRHKIFSKRAGAVPSYQLPVSQGYAAEKTSGSSRRGAAPEPAQMELSALR
jgi:two-component system, chemotaxis family, CheB/CheR fusion protein